MAKSQKKPVTLNNHSRVTRKPGKNVNKTSAKTTQKVAAKSAGDSKQSLILALLQGPTGATIDEMTNATGWQRHSVQGMMSGVLKKKLGFTVTSDKEERGRVYRIPGSVSRL